MCNHVQPACWAGPEHMRTLDDRALAPVRTIEGRVERGEFYTSEAMYDNLTGICLDKAGTSRGEAVELCPSIVNAVLTEDLFAEVMRHCSVPHRAQLASVCKLWSGFVRRGWSVITLEDPHLAKQINWLKKVNPKNTKELKVLGHHYPPGAPPVLDKDVLSCITRLSELRRLELDSDGRFPVSPTFLGQLSVLGMLDSLKAYCIAPNTEATADLSDLALLTGLRELDLGFLGSQRIVLSSELSRLTNLTSLQLRAKSLDQQEGPCVGALSRLLSHLQHLNIWVSEGLCMDLVSPTLTCLQIFCSDLHSSRPAACPRLLVLELSLTPLHTADLANMAALTSLRFEKMVTLTAIRALHNCSCLTHVKIVHYVCGKEDGIAFEEFSSLTSLEYLEVLFMTHQKKYSISPKLSSLRCLKRLFLAGASSHHYLGGLDVLPSLAEATFSGAYHGFPLHSTSLRRLVVAACKGDGYRPEEVLPLGSLPMLTSLTLSDVLEMHISRFLCIQSLCNLQELVVNMAYFPATEPLSTYQPEDDTDVTRLVASLHALPALHTVELRAIRRRVVLEQVGLASYKKLSLACAHLTIPPAEAAAIAELESLHLIVEDMQPEVVDMFVQMGAAHKVFSAGDLYMCKELHEVLRGAAQRSSGMQDACSLLKTVYDDGYFL